MKRTSFLLKALIAFCVLFCLPVSALAGGMPEVMFILDGSGSMWGTAGGQMKIAAAKEVLARVVPQLPPEVKVGLTAYGHRQKGDCADVEVLAPTGSDRQTLLAQARSITPKGKTPIAASVKMVAEMLKAKENETTIVLISDGQETCDPDPCGVVKALKQSGLKFVMHVVGFGVDPRGTEQLTCLAQAGGGKYFAASDAASLQAALEVVKTAVAQKVEQAKTTVVSGASKLGKLKVIMPASAVASLASVNILRAGKEIKKGQAAPEATHPLLAGKYQVVLAFANTNYRPPTLAPVGEVEVVGGQTVEFRLGAVVINLAPAFKRAIAAVGLWDQASGKPLVNIEAGGNDYYLYKAKPVPAGVYDLKFTFGRSKTPSLVTGGVRVTAGQETVVTLDSGLALKPVGNVVGWDLLPAGGGKPLIEVRRRWDNDYPLWEKFPVMPGRYDLRVLVKGMNEALPVGEGIQISKGQTLVFDTGL